VSLIRIDALRDIAADILPRVRKERAADSWQRYTRLAERLRAAWSTEVDTQTLLDEMRR
jgi:hypothetical protein